MVMLKKIFLRVCEKTTEEGKNFFTNPSGGSCKPPPGGIKVNGEEDLTQIRNIG